MPDGTLWEGDKHSRSDVLDYEGSKIEIKTNRLRFERGDDLNRRIRQYILILTNGVKECIGETRCSSCNKQNYSICL